MSLVLEAVALGLNAHQMGGFDAERLTATFGVPERFTPMAVIAVGFPGAPQDLPEEFQERELAERNRRPLTDIAFSGRWESPYLD
jgi:nitroreductase